ncbi:DUF6252 family protein [Flavobacterium sp.]|uniref:DUF6252 family protein n=1 Tax=Flavobacterium sp. TaxID=239 RepID=UPI00121B9EE8|nr:DUF6252 family protein [Flavobacterium sp.]RZJ70127.1 MAG: hypothetical protein EOO49_14965 [Flavobacterium sp.]
MTNKFLIAIMAFVSVFNIVSCDVEQLDPAVIPDPSNPNPTENGSFQVKVDGTQYTALTAQGFIAGGAITIAATRANGDSFAFVIGGNTSGSYAANQNILMFTQSGSEDGWQSVNPTNPGENTGSVVISSVNTTNHTITGTFQFKGYWNGTGDMAPKDFTEGTFTVPYTDDLGGPSTNDFSALVDGTAFNATNVSAQESVNGSISVISIAGISQNATISVIVNSDITVGNHPIATGSVITDGVQVMYLGAGGSGGPATSGSVNITQKTADHIKGTFTATIEGQTANYQITQGSFDVAY